MTDALPCPFCGANPATGCSLDTGYVACLNADCSVRPNVSLVDTPTASGFVRALTKWNTRATPAAVQLASVTAELEQYRHYGRDLIAAHNFMDKAGVPDDPERGPSYIVSRIEFIIAERDALKARFAEAEAKCAAACNRMSAPSAGHDYFDEVCGLLRVARSQRDDYARSERELLAKCAEYQAQLATTRDTNHD